MRLMLNALAFCVAILAALMLVIGVQHIRNSGQAAVPERAENALRIATQNVHYIILGQDGGRWSEAAWHDRKPALDAAFKALDADLLAVQEMESFARGGDGNTNLARDWLLAQNPEYGVAASGDARVFPSTQPIFYRKAALTPIEQGWFFFSDTPEVIYSRTFNGSYPAFCSWARFETQGGQRFTVFNVHFEFKSRSNRQLSAALVAQRMAPVIATGEPVILLGDLNARHGAKTQTILRDAGVTFLPVAGATYHLDAGLNLFGAIDHIGITSQFTAKAAPHVLRQKFLDHWPSDHYPVSADVTLTTK